jgi:4-hydroxybenzoate polyprenyltransferase
MLLTLLLDALSAIGEGEALLLLIKLAFFAAVPIGLLIHLWIRQIDKQLEREPKEVKPARQVKGEDAWLWFLGAIMLIALVTLGS